VPSSSYTCDGGKVVSNGVPANRVDSPNEIQVNLILQEQKDYGTGIVVLRRLLHWTTD